MDLHSLLQSIGLSEQESNTYLAMVGDDYLTATQIAKKVNAKRSSMYYVLESLLEKGIILASTSGIKKFKATTPENLVSVLEREQNRLEVVTKQLKKALPLFPTPTKKSADQSVEFFKGLEALKILNEKVYGSKSKKIYTFGVPFTMVESEENTYLRHFHEKRAKLGIHTYSILHDIPKDKILQNDKKYLREGRIAPKEMLGKTKSIISIVDESVIIMNLLPELSGMLVHDKTFSETLKYIWDTVWAVSQPIKS